MKLRIVAIALTAALIGPAALAAQITNLDEELQTVVVIVGEEQLEFTIPPTQSLDLGTVCANGCAVVLSSGQDYELAAGDVALIESGELKLVASDPGADSMKIEKEETTTL